MADPRVFAESGSGDHSPGSQAASSQPPGRPRPHRVAGAGYRGARSRAWSSLSQWPWSWRGSLRRGSDRSIGTPLQTVPGRFPSRRPIPRRGPWRPRRRRPKGAAPGTSWSPPAIDLPAPIVESTTLPSNLLGGSAGSACVGTSEASTSTVTLLGFSGNISLGQAPDWFFLLDGSGGTPLFVGVVGGQANIWEKFSGSECSLLALVGSIPGSIVDSSTAVAAALSDTGTGAGTSFIAAHPGVSHRFGDILRLVGRRGPDVSDHRERERRDGLLRVQCDRLVHLGRDRHGPFDGTDHLQRARRDRRPRIDVRPIPGKGGRPPYLMWSRENDPRENARFVKV